MGVNSSRAKYLPDTDASVLLRDVADGAETATATETAISLKELDSAYWHDGKDIPGGVFEVNINITAVAIDGGDEAYTFELMVDDTSNLGDTPRAVASLAFAAAQCVAGNYKMYVNSDQIKVLNSDSSGTDKWMAIRCTHAGSSSSITYGASIGKVVAFG